MKYLILIGLVCLVLGFGYSLLSSKPNPQYGYADSMMTPTQQVKSHTDSIDQFVKWYDNMCDTFCSLTELAEFQVVGPQKNAELNDRFSKWHIKLSLSDKKSIESGFKRNLKRLMIHSCNLMKVNGMLVKDITTDQIDMMVQMGERGFDIVMDTTTYLDYYVKWTVDNYKPPTGD